MKYLLVNDTSGTNNPGCRGTVACLRELLRHEGLTESATLPLCFGAEIFGKAGPEFTYVKKLWKTAKRRLRKLIPCTMPEYDVMVVNAEGTIHHNQTSALAILAMIDLAKDDGLPVIILNGTVQSMKEDLLADIFGKCDGVLVREKLSAAYLTNLGIEVKVAPDSLFTLGFDRKASSVKPGKPACLYTPGVLSLSGGLSEIDVQNHFDSIVSAGYELHYLVAEKEDVGFLHIAERFGARILGISDVPWFNLVRYLGQFSMVVSGRYHVCIFSWLARVPVVPLHTNTWKIRALFELAGDVNGSCDRDFQDAINKGGFVTDEPTLVALDRECRMAIADCLRPLKVRQ